MFSYLISVSLSTIPLLPLPLTLLLSFLYLSLLSFLSASLPSVGSSALCLWRIAEATADPQFLSSSCMWVSGGQEQRMLGEYGGSLRRWSSKTPPSPSHISTSLPRPQSYLAVVSAEPQVLPDSYQTTQIKHKRGSQ